MAPISEGGSGGLGIPEDGASMLEQNFRRPQNANEGYGDDNDDLANIEKATAWHSIFNFTTQRDLGVITSATVLTIVSGGFKPTLAIFLGRILDELVVFGAGTTTKAQLLKNVSMWCSALTGLGAVTWLLNGGFFALWLLFGELQAKHARDQILMDMIDKEMPWYDSHAEGISSLLTRIQTQVRELQMATSQTLGFFIEDLSVAVVATGIALYYSWKLTLVILLSLPILALGTHLAGRNLKAAVEGQKVHLTQSSKCAVAAVVNIDIVKAYNAQDQEAAQFQIAVEEAGGFYLAQARATALMMGFTRFMTVLMFVQGFWYGLILVRQGVRAGTIVTTFYSILFGVQSAESLIPQWIILKKGMSAGETLKHYVRQIKRGKKTTDLGGSAKPSKCSGDVRISNITFSYPSNPGCPVLCDVSLCFPSGRTTFVIGTSGSGKSTLGDLLMRYYSPSSGDISIDGEPIQTLDVEWLRNNITLVQQSSILFNETLFQNIAFGHRHDSTVSRDAMNIAFQTALLQQTIDDLPDGLNTMVGRGENSMSGGQRQRISIARARLRDSPILILDEATCSLDPISRTLIMDKIRKWRIGKTTIIITHDISQIPEDDFVYVLDNGKIGQQGYRGKLEEDCSGLFVSFLSCTSDVDDKKGASAAIYSFPDLPMLLAGSYNVVDTKSPDGKTIIQSTALDGLHHPRGASVALTSGVLMDDRAWKTPTGSLDHFTTPSTTKKAHPRMLASGLECSTYKSGDILERCSMNDSKLHSITVEREPRGRKLMAVRRAHDKLGSYKVVENVINDDHFGAIKPDEARMEDCIDYNEDVIFGDINNCFRMTPSSKQEIGHRVNVSIIRILGTVWSALLWYDRIVLVFGFFAAFVSAAATPAFSYVFARLLNTYYTPSNQSVEARKWATQILIIAVVDGLSTFYFHWFLEYCGQRWVDSLRIQAMKRILSQPKSWFDKEINSPGTISHALDRDAEEMRNVLGRFAGYIFVATSMMVVAIIWSFVGCWKLTLVGLASTPVIFVCAQLFERVTAKWESKSNVEAEKVAGIFSETVLNIRVVHALTLGRYFEDKHKTATLEAYKVGKRRAVYSGFFFGLSDSTRLFLTALVLYYGAVLVGSGAWSVDSILQVIALLLFSSSNAAAAMAYIPQISISKAAATQILHLAHLSATDSHELSGSQHLTHPFPIRLQNLSFTYASRPRAPVLEKLTLSFDTGSFTAIVGPSGSGKSTIAALLLGLYPPDGTPATSPPPLTFNGPSISTLCTSSLRSTIATVPQTPTLMPGTISENITYGLAKASPLRRTPAIESAARAAGIHHFVASLPAGYATRVGDGGQRLSGGQTQRIAIARALLRRPRLLILDEATSALDAESAAGVRAALRTLRRQRPDMALVAITHCVDMMRLAETVVVLERGRVVQQGPFVELIDRVGGPLRKLIWGARD